MGSLRVDVPHRKAFSGGGVLRKARIEATEGMTLGKAASHDFSQYLPRNRFTLTNRKQYVVRVECD